MNRRKSRIEERLVERARQDGPLTFAEVMEEALYGEGGYYAGSSAPIGIDGDFVTGSSFSPLFGRSTARVLARLGRALGAPADYLEVGQGNGEHLAKVAEVTAALPSGRILACDRVPRPAPGNVEQIDGLGSLAKGELSGLVFSYELFDAQPIHRLVGRAGGLGEVWVSADPEGRLRFEEGDLSDPELASLLCGASLEPGQIADLSPDWRPLYRALVAPLARGLVVTCDYGFERSALLDSRIRRLGTLACYREQRVHRDPLRALGEDDLTAHVDFTALRETGEELGLETVTLTRQARWLLAAGLFEDLEGADAAQRTQAMTLLDGAGMGEEIRVLVQAKGVEVDGVLSREMLGGVGSESP